MDTKQYNRSIYSILDFLGDVGGLLSILLPIGGAIIALLDELLKRTLDNFIIQNVFFQKKQTDKTQKNFIAGTTREKNDKLTAYPDPTR